MDTSGDEQKAKILAFLLLSEISGNRCTPEYLSSICLAFSATAREIRRLCKLPNVPLRLIDDDRLIEVSKSFDIRLSSLVSLLHNQSNNIGTGGAKHVVDPPFSKKDELVVAKPSSILEPIVVRSDFDCVNAIQLEPADTEILNQVERSSVLLPTGNGLATNGSPGHNDNENLNSLPQRPESDLPAAYAGSPGNPLQQIEHFRLATHSGNLCEALERAEKAHLATSPVENLSNTPQRTEKTPLATAAACLAEQGLVPPLNEINFQPKKKSRDSRSVPRFEDYDVDGEVGAGGYGTVYKVRQHSDGQVFAMKCPLENTHDSNVRNEISMLKRLRGKDYIIQFQNEVIGKVSPKSDTGGGEEVACPSILLEFIEHDKPEILKKEITIDELKCYSISLFKALAQLHEERILHLDVKPGNFLFSRSRKRGCLVDFNLARNESVKRPSTRRPERGSSRALTAEAKTFERRKCPKRPFLQEDTPLTRVIPSKRSRQILGSRRELGTPPPANLPFGDQSKQTLRSPASKDASASSPKYQQCVLSPTGAITALKKPAEPLKANGGLDNAGNAQVETSKNQQMLIRDLAGKRHRIATWLKERGSENTHPSTAPFTQTKGVSVVKLNTNKRVPARCPRPLQSVQPASAKRVKPAHKVKPPCYQLKDGPCVGTKGYRAPEVLMRSTRQTTKVDIWSAGVSLLQLVTGRSPFPSTSTEGALKDIAKLRGSFAIDNLAKSLGQRLRFSKDHTYPGVSVKEWSDKYSRRTDLKRRIPLTLYDLIEKCLDVNPDSRITAEAALLHQFCSIDETAEFSKRPNLIISSGSDLASMCPDVILGCGVK